jgi:hypothetical protein
MLSEVAIKQGAKVLKKPTIESMAALFEVSYNMDVLTSIIELYVVFMEPRFKVILFT